jgi:hypothetical protein
VIAHRSDGLGVVMMKRALSVPQKNRGKEWAHDVCAASRDIHMDVWTSCPPLEYVRETVIPLLTRANKALLHVARTSQTPAERQQVNCYAENEELRLRNIIDNYCTGKPSALLPHYLINDIARPI